MISYFTIPAVLMSMMIVLATFVLDVLLARVSHGRLLRPVTILGFLLSIIVLPFFPASGFVTPLLRLDAFGVFFAFLCLTIGLLVALASRENRLAFYGSLLLAAVGMLLAATTADLILLYIAIELVTAPTYVLVAYHAKNESLEAGVKYFVVSIVASSLLLLGIVLLAASAGTTTIAALTPDISSFFMLGVGALLAGLGFKLGFFPFNLWIPDVYQGSSGEVAGLLAGASKKAAFAAFIPLSIVLAVALRAWPSLIAILAALTMTIPNLIALVQKDVRRLLAYSIMTHAGFLLMGVAVGGLEGYSGTLFHAFTHGFMALGAFLVVGFFSMHGMRKIDQLNGIGYRNPVLGVSLTLFLLSLAGIPLLAGFASKFYLFLGVAQGGMIWLTVLAILNSAIALYYYFRVIRAMYGFQPAGQQLRVRYGLLVAILVCAFVVLFLGLYPAPIIDLAVRGVNALL